jgi:adenylosuccinate lyase
MKVWKTEGRCRFLDLLKADPDVRSRLDEEALAALFDPSYHTRHVETIFRRVFGDAAPADASG